VTTTAGVDQALLDKVLGDLGRDGYAVAESLLSPDEAIQVRDGLREVLDSTPTGRNDFEGFLTRRIYALFAKTRAFDALATHPLLLAVLDATLGPSYQLSAPTGIEIGPGEKAQFLHTDDGIYPLPRPHPEVVLNTMWALDDFTEANGATRVVPGSHRWPDRSLSPAEQVSQPSPRPEQIAYAEMAAGSAVIYLGGTIHAGGANVTSTPRRGAHLSYCLGWLRTEENNYLSVPPAIAARLPRAAQELLGYALHDSISRGGGYLGMVQMQDPVDLLAKGKLS
jgi:ectoine hydroxylase-related dioxygenase (phytanoyl-CoA dioxygenase family)